MFTLGRGPRTAVTLPALVAGLVAAGLGCWHGLADDRAAALAPHATLAALLTGAAAITLQVALGWLLVVTLLLALEPRAGRELTGFAGCPRGVRRALLLACGVTLAGAALSAPANAHGDGPAPSSTIDGLPLPDRTSGRPAPRPAPGAQRLVVRPGDTLWSIASRRLPAGAPTAAVDRAWRSLYAANRGAIGPDPDLIQIGTELRLPPAVPSTTEEENQ